MCKWKHRTGRQTQNKIKHKGYVEIGQKRVPEGEDRVRIKIKLEKTCISCNNFHIYWKVLPTNPSGINTQTHRIPQCIIIDCWGSKT